MTILKQKDTRKQNQVMNKPEIEKCDSYRTKKIEECSKLMEAK